MSINKIFNCIIVDDEAHCIEALKKHIANIPYLNLIKVYDNSLDAAREITIINEQIDFLFLDIDMPNLSGLELASIIRNKVDKLIFVTGHSKYSLEAFDVLCNQYLLKPYSLQQFINTINKLIELPQSKGATQTQDFLFIKDSKNGQYIKIKLNEIICINALEHYIIINTVFAKYTHLTSMKETEKSLIGSEKFIRIHKSSIISKEHIVAINGSTVLLTNNHKAEIGKTYKQNFKNFIDTNSLL